MEPLGDTSEPPMTYLDKERLLQANGVAVPHFPKPPSEGPIFATVEEANFLAACDSWEFEVDRLYALFVKNHPEHWC